MGKVLIIEDEEGIQSLLRRIMGILGHDVLAAADGATGCRLAKENDVALIISDLSLPGTPRGLELIRALRAARPECPLIVSTGYTTHENIVQIEHEGVRHILHKPFDMPAVRSLVVSLIGDARKPS